MTGTKSWKRKIDRAWGRASSTTRTRRRSRLQLRRMRFTSLPRSTLWPLHNARYSRRHSYLPPRTCTMLHSQTKGRAEPEEEERRVRIRGREAREVAVGVEGLADRVGRLEAGDVPCLRSRGRGSPRWALRKSCRGISTSGQVGGWASATLDSFQVSLSFPFSIQYRRPSKKDPFGMSCS